MFCKPLLYPSRRTTWLAFCKDCVPLLSEREPAVLMRRPTIPPARSAGPRTIVVDFEGREVYLVPNDDKSLCEYLEKKDLQSGEWLNQRSTMQESLAERWSADFGLERALLEDGKVLGVLGFFGGGHEVKRKRK